MYRRREGALEVLLVHPGGPFWAKKDAGVWSIPKGEIEEGEEPIAGARREFQEETGFHSAEPFLTLGEVRQNGRKTVLAWGFEGDCDPADLTSISCEIEWPPRSGRTLRFPEIDRGAWFSLADAGVKIISGQLPLLTRLADALNVAGR